MQLNSSNSPIYLPQKDQDSILRLGLEHCAIDDWLFDPADLGVFHRHKLVLAETMPDGCQGATATSGPAQAEFHDFLLQHLLAHPSLGYSRNGSLLVHEAAGLSWQIERRELWPASLWIPEDICLMEETDDHYRLTAASVCSPSNWLLSEKIGQTVDRIHGPVPDYDAVLGTRVNRFLQGLRSERVMLRYNWSIQQGNELYWRSNGSDIEENPAQKYWRIERQTFLRLPETGAIVFGIRIFLHSFESLSGVKGFDLAIKSLLAQLPNVQKHYKGLG